MKVPATAHIMQSCCDASLTTSGSGDDTSKAAKTPVTAVQLYSLE